MQIRAIKRRDRDRHIFSVVIDRKEAAAAS
jgi:hypothetical protein